VVLDRHCSVRLWSNHEQRWRSTLRSRFTDHTEQLDCLHLARASIDDEVIMMSPCKSPQQPVNGVFIIHQISPFFSSVASAMASTRFHSGEQHPFRRAILLAASDRTHLPLVLCPMRSFSTLQRPAVSTDSLHLQVHLPPTPPPHTASWPPATQCALAVPIPSHPA